MSSTTPIDLYLAGVKPEYKALLEDLRKTIKQIVPDAEEVISYGIPAFKYRGKVVAGFAAFKNHCSFFPFSGGILSQFKEELMAFDQTKSSLHFTTRQLVPKELIRRMVELKLTSV